MQEKNKAVWEAILLIANTSNGEKILYDINPIKMVEGSGKESVQTSTNDRIPQTPQIVKKLNSDRDYSHDEFVSKPDMIVTITIIVSLL